MALIFVFPVIVDEELALAVDMMFQNSVDQDTICQVLKAYMEEWGTENVIVSLPKQWREFGSENVAGVRFEFSTSNMIAIRAEYNNEVSVHYEYQLGAA